MPRQTLTAAERQARGEADRQRTRQAVEAALKRRPAELAAAAPPLQDLQLDQPAAGRDRHAARQPGRRVQDLAQARLPRPPRRARRHSQYRGALGEPPSAGPSARRQRQTRAASAASTRTPHARPAGRTPAAIARRTDPTFDAQPVGDLLRTQDRPGAEVVERSGRKRGHERVCAPVARTVRTPPCNRRRGPRRGTHADPQEQKTPPERGVLAKPSVGLEPTTPSLPWKCSTN
jgi:hypothetical protein